MHSVSSSSPSPLPWLLFYAGAGAAYGHSRSSCQSSPDRLLASTHGKVFVRSNDQCNGMETELLRLSRGRETWRKQAAESTGTGVASKPTTVVSVHVANSVRSTCLGKRQPAFDSGPGLDKETACTGVGATHEANKQRTSCSA
jgi:hypothetical protein